LGVKELANVVYDLCRPAVAEEGLVLIDVEVAPGARTILRFVIDGDGGATIDDCVRIDRVVGGLLREWEGAPPRYAVEVTSPGLERRIRRTEEYEHFRGRRAVIHAEDAGGENRRYVGLLGGLEGDDLLLESEGETVRIPVERIHKARLWFEAPGGERSGRKR